MKRLFITALFLSVISIAVNARADVTIVQNGAPRVAVYVAPRVMEADKKLPAGVPTVEREGEKARQRLRESVNDLARYLGEMSGTQIQVLTRAPQSSDKFIPIYVGEWATQKFGALKIKTPFQQGWRMTVKKDGIGLCGENDESASYAIYEVLDRLGCRWFLPGDLGEFVPRRSTLSLQETDVSDAPDTEYRNVWYGDDAFKRRNRLGGFNIAAGHALNTYLTKEQLTAHPEWNAEHDGKREIASNFLCWGNPEVASAVADSIIARLDKSYAPSISLSPHDGIDFCECEKWCKPLDAGDWDPTMEIESITDRYIVFCNRIAEKVTKKYPDVQFGFLAYVQYTRAPVREKLHPNLVPVIAPITYCRAHTMTSQNCPSRPQLRPIVEGWGKASRQVAYYNYMFHLAEVSVPYPMIRQMSEELPILYKNNVQFWQPETMPNFEEVLPGMWLSLRMAWNKEQKPQAILDEFFTRFYGATSTPMRRYWQVFDDAWTQVPEHAGCVWGHARRFPPETMKAAREAMNSALAQASTPLEYRRVQMQERALRQFERFMQMRYDLNEGRLANLDRQGVTWLGTQLGLGDEYDDNEAFDKVYWAPNTIAGGYFKSFVEATYNDAARIAKEYSVISPPLRQWKYSFINKKEIQSTDAQPDKDTTQRGERNGWHNATFDDGAWKTTDTGVETWSDLGLLGQYGTMWYRANVKLPKLPEDRKVFLWLAATDGSAKVFVNGQHVPYINVKDEKTEVASGYASPFSFDISAAIKPDEENQITIAGTRAFLNELGTGGLLGPVYLYRQK